MYSAAFHPPLIDARIEELRRARGKSMQSHLSRDDRNPYAAARSGLLSRLGIRRLVFADPSRAN
jgi:hypothetical protein